MTPKRVLRTLSASLAVMVILAFLVIGLNRPVDGLSLLLMCALVVGAGVLTGMRTKNSQRG